MTWNARRKTGDRQAAVTSRPFGVPGPRISTARRKISGRRSRTEPRQASANTTEGTDPSRRKSLALWLVRPSIVPTRMPARIITAMTSSRRSTTAPMAMPSAGSTPLITSAATAPSPAERSSA
jgi:hypothetical protein